MGLDWNIFPSILLVEPMSLNNPPSLFSSTFHDSPDLSLHRPTTPVHSEPDQAKYASSLSLHASKPY